MNETVIKEYLRSFKRVQKYIMIKTGEHRMKQWQKEWLIYIVSLMIRNVYEVSEVRLDSEND